MIERPTTPEERKWFYEASRLGHDAAWDPTISWETLWDKYRGFSMADLHAMNQMLLESIVARGEDVDRLRRTLYVREGEDEQAALKRQANELSQLEELGLAQFRRLSTVDRLIRYRFDHGMEMPVKWKDLTEEDRQEIINPPDKRELWKKWEAEVKSVYGNIVKDHPEYGQGDIITAIQKAIWPDGEAPSESTIRRYLGWK